MNNFRRSLTITTVAVSVKAIVSPQLSAVVLPVARQAPSLLLRSGLGSRTLIQAAIASGFAIAVPDAKSFQFPALLAFLSIVGAHKLSQRLQDTNRSVLTSAPPPQTDTLHDQTRAPQILTSPFWVPPQVTPKGVVVDTRDGFVNVGESTHNDMNSWEMALFNAYGFAPPGNASARREPSSATAEAISDAWGAMLGQPLHRRQVAAVRWWESADKRIVTALSKPLETGQVLAVALDAKTGAPIPFKNPQG